MWKGTVRPSLNLMIFDYKFLRVAEAIVVGCGCQAVLWEVVVFVCICYSKIANERMNANDVPPLIFQMGRRAAISGNDKMERRRGGGLGGTGSR